MVNKLFRIFRHAIIMVRRTLKSYVMLSVTIVLSFSLLLGYLIYTDSSSYNKYKYIFSQDRNVLSLYDANMENEKVEILLKQVDEMENAYHYIMYETSACIFQDGECILDDGRSLNAVYTSVKCVPNRVWGIYNAETEPIDITYLDGIKHEGIILNAGEAFMDEITFHLLGLDQMEEPVYNLSLYTEPTDLGGDTAEAVKIPVKIVGTFSSSTNHAETLIKENEDGSVSLDYGASICLSVDDFNMNDYPSFHWQRRLYFYSETPELVSQAADRLSYTSSISVGEGSSLSVKEFSAVGVYSQQNEALEKMQTEARTKAIIAAALLLLLGINLYSSFTNALNERKFEIGVKRAIGATGWEIIRQFLYESILVMIANVVLSIALVTDIFIVYKFIYELIPDKWGNFSQWVIYVSPYSIAMFGICSVTLTVVFSFIFAYKSTQVEIVQYLKAE